MSVYVNISGMNWTNGFFRIWLSASIVWWVALTTSAVSNASREAQKELWRSQGIECSVDSDTPIIDLPDNCQSTAGDASIPSLSLRDLLYHTKQRLQANAHSTRGPLLVSVPLAILLAAILIQRWIRWIHRGFVQNSNVRRVQEHAMEDDRPPEATLYAVGAKGENSFRGMSAGGDREGRFRANIVRATQNLNGLDDQLAELELQLMPSSKELGKELRREIPGWGRRLIALVQSIDKEGLAPDNLRFFGDREKINLGGMTEANPEAIRDTKDEGKGISRTGAS